MKKNKSDSNFFYRVKNIISLCGIFVWNLGSKSIVVD